MTTEELERLLGVIESAGMGEVLEVLGTYAAGRMAYESDYRDPKSPTRYRAWVTVWQSCKSGAKALKSRVDIDPNV